MDVTSSGKRAYPLSAADGVWRSRGYGWVFRISSGRVVGHDVGEGVCITNSWQDDQITAHQIVEATADGRLLKLAIGDPAYAYVFDRLPKMPATTSATATASATAVLNRLVQIFADHYPFFKNRNVDWPRVVAHARAGVTATTSSAQLFDVLEAMLMAVKDGHVTLEATVDGKAQTVNSLSARVLQRAADGAPPLVVPPALAALGVTQDVLFALARGDTARGVKITGDIEDAASFGTIGAEVAYLRVRSVEGDERAEVEAVVERAVRKMQGRKAVIVDLRENGGGDDTVSRSIAGRFTATPVLAYAKAPGDASDVEMQPVRVEPHAGLRYDGPVYVLTDCLTASAAEILTMCLRAMPHVTHFGEPTEGILSDMLTKMLPNGWILTVSNEVYLDHEGRSWEGIGVPIHGPDRGVPVA